MIAFHTAIAAVRLLIVVWVGYEIWVHRCKVIGHKDHAVRIGEDWDHWQCSRCRRID